MNQDSHPFDATNPGEAGLDEWLRHARWVRALASDLVRDASTADDLVQETWLAMQRQPPGADVAVRSWLARVVKNLALSRRRSEQRRARREVARGTSAEGTPTDEIAATLEMQEMLLEQVRALDEPLRATITRRYFHGKTAAEIAHEDGVSDSIVRRRIAQGLEILRSRMDARHRGDRGAWIALVLPLAGVPRASAPIPAPQLATAGALGTLLTMNLIKLGVAVVVVIAGVSVFVASRSGSSLQRTTEQLTDTHSASLAVDSAEMARNAAGSERAAIVSPADAPAKPDASATPASEAVVEARIVDERGAPVAGATATCKPARNATPEHARPAPTARSDANGVLRLAMGPEDLAQYGSIDFDQASDHWKTTLHFEAPGRIELDVDAAFTSGRTSSLGDVVLFHSADVLGRVVDAGGAARADIILTLELPDGSSLPGRLRTPHDFARTDAQGAYELRRVPIGVYRVHAEADWVLAATSDVFELHAGEVRRLRDIVCDVDANAIEGVVLESDGKPCASARIQSRSAQGTTGPDTGTREAGRFTLRVEKNSVLDLAAYSAQGEAHVAGIAAGTKDLSIRLMPLVDLDILVQSNAGVPLLGYEVGWSTASGRGTSIENAGQHDGHTRLKVSPVLLTLTASAPGFGTRVLHDFDPHTAANPTILTLEPLPTLGVTVMRAGQPVPNAIVALRFLVEDSPPVVTNGFHARKQNLRGNEQTDSFGRAAFTCRDEGRFLVCASAADLAQAESDVLELGPNLPSREIVLNLSSGGSLEGRVIADSGDESRARFVAASRGGNWTPAVPIGPDGSFHFDHLTVGSWWIRRTIEDYGYGSETRYDVPSDPTAAEVTIAEGATTHADLDMRGRSAPILSGMLSIAGVDMHTWGARLEIPNAHQAARDSCALNADGSFRLVLEFAGRAQLVLSASAPGGVVSTLETGIDLAWGANAWSLDVPLGALVVDAHSGGAGEIEHVARLANGAVFTTRAAVSAGGSISLDHVPAGHAQLLDAKSGAVLAEVDVPIGGTACVALH
jgi:RNA polymerase sigma factor (sigma-70 family)